MKKETYIKLFKKMVTVFPYTFMFSNILVFGTYFSIVLVFGEAISVDIVKRCLMGGLLIGFVLSFQWGQGEM